MPPRFFSVLLPITVAWLTGCSATPHRTAIAPADLLASTGRLSEARAEYDAALALDPEPAEARLLAARRDALGS